MAKPASPARMLTRAERLIEAGLKERRGKYDAHASAIISGFARNGAAGGNAYRRHLRVLCTTELHSRVAAITRRLLRAHKSIDAPPTDAYRQAARDWIAAVIADEAKDLQRHLWKPNLALGERGPPDILDLEMRREVARNHATIDQVFDQLRHDRVERALRWVTRATPGIGAALRRVLGR